MCVRHGDFWWRLNFSDVTDSCAFFFRVVVVVVVGDVL